MNAPSRERADAYAERVRDLRAALGALDGVAVAFSGGVDSTVLLHAAHDVLGARAVALIADSASLPRAELEEARGIASRIGAALIELATDELEDERYQSNRGDRCYFCKAALFDSMSAWARAHGVATLAFGEIVDDLGEDRPGRRAAGEFRVRAPLAEAGLSKDDVRRYAREHDLPVADKPASACLASRIPVGTRVTRERLARVERAEAGLRALGLRVLRVRDRGDDARLEVGEAELERAREQRGPIGAALTAAGFRSYELATYRAPSSAARDTDS